MPTGAGILRQASYSTRCFLYNRWVARRTAAMTMIVLYLCLIWVILGQDGASYPLRALVIIACALFAAIFMVISRHPITRLRVGPDGLTAPFGLMRRIKWQDIESAHYVPKRPLLWYAQEWLHVRLKPGTTGVLRIPLPRNLEEWVLEKVGVHVPLHALHDPSGEVLASIERFMPVLQTDLAPESTAVP